MLEKQLDLFQRERTETEIEEMQRTMEQENVIVTCVYLNETCKSYCPVFSNCWKYETIK